MPMSTHASTHIVFLQEKKAKKEKKPKKESAKKEKKRLKKEKRFMKKLAERLPFCRQHPSLNLI